MSQFTLFEQTSDPSTPGAGQLAVYAKSDSLFIKNELGVVTDLGIGVGGSIADKQVAFGVGTNIGGDADFTWDNTGKVLAATGTVNFTGPLNVIGTSNFTGTLDVTGEVNGGTLLSTSNSTTYGSGGAGNVGTTTGGFNTAFGVSSLSKITTPFFNTGLGYFAIGNVTSGGQNTAVGGQALVSLISGANNVAVGAFTGGVLSAGSDNIFIGNSLNSPANNTNFYLTLKDTIFADTQNDFVRIGGSGVVAGPETLRVEGSQITTGTINGGTLLSTTGSNNTTYGGSGSGNVAATTGNLNDAFGAAVLTSVTSGNSNGAFGSNSLQALTTGNLNVSVGTGNLNSLAGGGGNLVFGANSGSILTGGGANILIGNSVDAPAAGTVGFLNIDELIFGNTTSTFVRIGGSGVITGPETLRVEGDQVNTENLFVAKQATVGATSGALTDFTVFQNSTNVNKGITLSGTGVTGSASTTEGVVLAAGLVLTGNNQLWIMNKVDQGNSAKNSFRFITGQDVPLIVGVTNTGTANKSLAFGLNAVGAGCGFGFPLTVTQAQILAQVHANAGLPAIIPMIAQGAASQTANLLQMRNSAGTVLSFFDQLGNLNAPIVTASQVIGTSASGSTGSGIRAVATLPGIELNKTNAAVDEKSYDFIVFGSSLLGRVINDANTIAPAWIEVKRTGTTVGEINFPVGNFAIGGSAANSKLQVFGSFAVKRTGTAGDVNTDDEVIIGVTSTAAARTITIQSADIVVGRVFIIKDESGAASVNNITIDTQGAETIDGAATVVIIANYGSVRLYSDGTNLFSW